jgi:hypothetical protein
MQEQKKIMLTSAVEPVSISQKNEGALTTTPIDKIALIFLGHGKKAPTPLTFGVGLDLHCPISA